MEQYLALSRENQALGVVKPEIKGNVNFKIKSQFMRELREDTFFGNKDEDVYDYIDWVLSIFGLINIPGVSKDAVMLRVFPFTLKPDIPANDGWKTKPPGKHQYLGSPQEGLYPKETSGLNKLHGVSFISDPKSDATEVLQHQLPHFVIIDNTPSETTILRRLFLATIRAEIDVFAIKISLGINEDRISFDSMRNSHKYTNPSEKNFTGNSACENNPTHRSFDDYKWEFNLEIDKLADEYDMNRKEGTHSNHIWEYCNHENPECLSMGEFLSPAL
ncbi:hypothetical protein Tco_0039654 [Tanacetum coccineum]